MSTVVQRLQHYRSHHASPVDFSKNKLKSLGNILKNTYDRSGNMPPVQYVEVQVNGETFNVRDYPAFFDKTIDIWILRFHDNIRHGEPLVRKNPSGRSSRPYSRPQPDTGTADPSASTPRMRRRIPYRKNNKS
jgi:hypothetical protein